MLHVVAIEWVYLSSSLTILVLVPPIGFANDSYFKSTKIENLYRLPGLLCPEHAPGMCSYNLHFS